MESINARIHYGPLKFDICGCIRDPITQFHLKNGGFYDRNALERMAELVRRLSANQAGCWVLDAGANIGNHTLFFAATCPLVKVVSFEMNPTTYAFLRDNVEGSSLKNITHFNMGLSNAVGTCGIRDNPTNPLGGATLSFHVQDEQCVKLVSIDACEALKSIGGRCVLVKLDVEGHEISVLEGALHFISSHRPMFHAELKDVDQYKRFYTILSSMGYEVVYAEDAALPDFLFVHQEDIGRLFSNQDLRQIRESLCLRVVESWQLHRKLKQLTQA